jgi:membrane-associated phospholipid phosphatase
MRLVSIYLSISLAVGTMPALAQVAPPIARPDTLHKYENPPGAATLPAKSFFRSKGFRAAIVPAVFIAYGASTINGHGLYSSYSVKSDINHLFGPGRHTHVDDYLQFAPYLELGGVLLAGVESRNDRLNLGLVIVKSEVLMLSSVFVVKHLTAITRPDGSDNFSFPSGHTAQAFLAASIVHTELRDKSQWYGIGAYAIATGVGVLRMVNDKHWESDVLAGVGFGILSAHVAYLTHRNRWGRRSIGRDVGLVPSWSPGGGMGLRLTWRPR